jgi:hypothetical protein
MRTSHSTKGKHCLRLLYWVCTGCPLTIVSTVQVAMPREKGAQAMLENSKKFESLLHELLGEDYNGFNPDKAAYPNTSSLVGDDGSFLLLRLTGSPMFQALKSSIIAISEIADDVLADTPGKAAFDWIRSSVGWIEAIHASVAVAVVPSLGEPSNLNRLVLPKEDATRLLKEGEDILFNFPEDLRSTLSQHKIYVSSNKDGKLTVKSRKGGSHHAAGVVAIRWCPFLLDSLKTDLARRAAWEKSIGSVCSDFIVFKEAMDTPAGTAERIVRLYEFRDALIDLMDEASDLVVAPCSLYIDPAKSLFNSIEITIQRSMTPAIAESFVNSKYKHGSTVVSDRGKLLIALAARQAIDSKSTTMDLESREGHFRNAARILIVKALRKVMTILGITDEYHAASWCSLKAWDIENALFDEYQGELGESRISTEYRDKARALRRSIEDIDNIGLCARVLSDEISARTLARMSTEELANQSTKQQRASAKAKQNRDLTSAQPSSNEQRSPRNAYEVHSEPLKHPPTVDVVTSPVLDESTANSSASPTASRSPRAPNLGDFVRTARASYPPPPPPSLAAISSIPRNGDTAEEFDLISNQSGENRFRVSLSNSSLQLMAGFSAAYKAGSISSGVLPERLTEKGKVAVQQLATFIREKTASQKWTVALLRMTLFSEKDRHEFKKFYKAYEKRQRIAMLSVNESMSLYLVTPMFHHELSAFASFEKSTSTYGLMLIRDFRSP